MLETPRLPCDSIIIARDTRQRKRVETSDLELSIRERGVLQPIIVEQREDGVHLIAGERRLTASKKLGLADIPVRFLGTLPPLERAIVELEENSRRIDLTWQDLVCAVRSIHLLGEEANPTWSTRDLATVTGYNRDTLHCMLSVAEAIDDPQIKKCTSYGAAYNVLSRDRERKYAAAVEHLEQVTIGAFPVEPEPPAPAPEEPEATIDDLAEALLDTLPEDQRPARPAAKPAPAPASDTAARPDPIICQAFGDWAESYTGPRFNALHCDFPYGINFNAGEQGGRNDYSGYDDSPEVFWTLCSQLCEHMDKLVTPSAHMIFWFSMNYYSDILAFFGKHAPDWVFNRHPLIWLKSDNVGVAPVPRRGPRRIVETAFLATRGDRPIVKLVSNGVAASTDKSLHQSTKPDAVHRHFLPMIVDSTTRMLDPTAGSGSALRIADELGAGHVLGLEINPDHASAANVAFRKASALRRASKALGKK